MSDLSIRAKRRNWFKAQLLSSRSILLNQKVITSSEKRFIEEIGELINVILEDFNNNSKLLGFKPRLRCGMCSRIAFSQKEIGGRMLKLCKKHTEEWDLRTQ